MALTKTDQEYETLKIVTRGRKSDLPHIAIVRFVRSNNAFLVLSGKRVSDWVQNALVAGSVKVRIGNHSQDATCEVFPDKQEVLKLFSQKYGTTLVNDWYSASQVCLKLTPTSEPTLRGSVRGEGEAKQDLEAWKKSGTGYYSAISEAFDSASEEYDFTIAQNFINVWIRERSIKELLSLSRPDDVLLEIGCGTGVEALEISKYVKGIVATDISKEMISLVDRKVSARGLGSKIRSVQLGASEIEQVAPYLPNGKVRIAYSFNGALNCEPRIEEFSKELANIIQPGGYFVCSIRNTLCMSEAISHALVLQFDKMAPRKKQPVMVSVGGIDIPSYYYPPVKFTQFFTKNFRVKKIIGLPAILPPAYLSNLYFKARKVLSFAERVEVALASHYPLNRFGDQSLTVFQRKISG